MWDDLRMDTSKSMRVESRKCTLSDLEYRGTDDNTPGTIVGHAAVFNQLSPNHEGFREQIAPGAFSKSLSDGTNIVALWGHDDNLPIASTASGTLVLSEDEVGLRAEITPANTTYAKDLAENIRAGIISDMSFRFRVRAGGEQWTEEDGTAIRTLTDLELSEVSPVTWGYYPQTDVAVRSFNQWREAKTLNVAAWKARRRAQLEMKLRGIPENIESRA